MGIEHVVANGFKRFARDAGASREEAEEHEEAVGGPGCLEGLDEAVVGYLRRFKVAQLSHSCTLCVEHPYYIAQNRLLDDCDGQVLGQALIANQGGNEQMTETGTSGFRCPTLEEQINLLVCATCYARVFCCYTEQQMEQGEISLNGLFRSVRQRAPGIATVRHLRFPVELDNDIVHETAEDIKGCRVVQAGS